MKWNEYIGNAKRTESIPTDGWRGSVPVELWRLNHAVLGLTTEVNEFKNAASGKHLTLEENRAEEIGDLAWYTAIAWDVLLPVDYNPTKPAVDPADPLAFVENAMTRIADCVKRAIYYGKELNYPVCRDAIVEVQHGISLLAGSSETFSQILDRNIAKLRARYPQKWDSDLAVNRDLAAEAAALKQG
jgi:hypothetical protein